MPLIPMKQTVTVTPAASDDWDGAAAGVPYTLKCRISEGTKLVRKASTQGGVSSSDNGEVVSVAQIYFDKLVSIAASDTISYTDENGEVCVYRPISTEVKRNLAGKPILTVVNV